VEGANFGLCIKKVDGKSFELLILGNPTQIKKTYSLFKERKKFFNLNSFTLPFMPSHHDFSIVFVHKGNQMYFDRVLQMTRLSNPTVPILLLGDATNKGMAEIHSVQHYLYEDYAEPFDKYIHVSVNNYAYEKFCFERWIIFKNFLLQTDTHSSNSHRFIYCDSDCAILQDISYLREIDELYTCDILTFSNNEVIVPCLFVSTKTVFIDIGDSILSFYASQDKRLFESQVVTSTENGRKHFSDMYLLRQVVKDKFSIFSLEDIHKFRYQFNASYYTMTETEKLNAGNVLFNIHYCGESKKHLLL